MTTVPQFILYIAISKNAMGMLVFLIAITIPLSSLIHWRIRNFPAASICSALLADVVFQWYSYCRNGSIASAFLISVIFVGIYAFIISSFVGSLFERKRKTQRRQCLKCGYVHMVNDNGDCSKCGTKLSEPLESRMKQLNVFKFDNDRVVGFAFCCLAINVPGILWHIPVLRLAILQIFLIWLKIPEFLFATLILQRRIGSSEAMT